MDKSKVTISRIRGKVILFLFIFCAFEVFYSQKPLPPAFDGYHKAAPNEIKSGSPIMLDPSVTPIFNDTFKLLNDSEVQQMLQSEIIILNILTPILRQVWIMSGIIVFE